MSRMLGTELKRVRKTSRVRVRIQTSCPSSAHFTTVAAEIICQGWVHPYGCPGLLQGTAIPIMGPTRSEDPRPYTQLPSRQFTGGAGGLMTCITSPQMLHPQGFLPPTATQLLNLPPFLSPPSSSPLTRNAPPNPTHLFSLSPLKYNISLCPFHCHPNPHNHHLSHLLATPHILPSPTPVWCSRRSPSDLLKTQISPCHPAV